MEPMECGAGIACEIDETAQTTEMWWMLDMSEIGEASDKRKKTWRGITGEKEWTCNKYQKGGKDKFFYIAYLNKIKNFGTFFKL